MSEPLKTVLQPPPVIKTTLTVGQGPAGNQVDLSLYVLRSDFDLLMARVLALESEDMNVLDFSVATNSQYLPLLSIGVM